MQNTENNRFSPDHRATYSPEDNKLRFYPGFWLDKEDYSYIKSKGFIWAPKQDLLVAPMWTPEREDALLEFCGSIDDEDSSLVDRAEFRAERFENYSEKRLEEANQAEKAVAQIADNIPFGQPIMIGHHSEKKARRDAKKIENGMRKAVNLWDTSKYWQYRAAAALRHAKYKELPAVRARRIKKMESEMRKYKASYTPKNPDEIIFQTPWSCPVCRKPFCKEHPEANEKIEHVFCGHSRGGSWVPVKNLAGIEKYYSRWIAHCEKRLLYEKAMLGEQGKLDLLEKKKRPKQLPLLNYRAPEGLSVENMYHRGEFSTYPQVVMTKAEYSKIYNDYKGTAVIEKSHRVRIACNVNGAYSRCVVFLTDSKVHQKPEVSEIEESNPVQAPVNFNMPVTLQQSADYGIKKEPTVFDEMKKSLESKVNTIVVDQLFETPAELAERMVFEADIQPGSRVLEPSAGTGKLLDAIISNDKGRSIVAVEINYNLVENLKKRFPLCFFHQKDFLDYNDHGPHQSKFDCVLMNPPFKNAEDIKHIKHALGLLKTGGRLVAICVNGPRQREIFKPLADASGGFWEDLPAGTFKQQGTMVNSALVVINN